MSVEDEAAEARGEVEGERRKMTTAEGGLIVAETCISTTAKGGTNAEQGFKKHSTCIDIYVGSMNPTESAGPEAGRKSSSRIDNQIANPNI